MQAYTIINLSKNRTATVISQAPSRIQPHMGWSDTPAGNYMNILIAGIPGQTVNYEKSLSCCHVSFETSLCPSEIASFDKLLLPGGGDIHPSWFGRTDQGSCAPDRELDRIQFSLLHRFILHGKPVFGICRGMQMINVYFGGTLIQNLPTADRHRYQGADQVHPAGSVPGSLLSLFYPGSCLINSAHHQGCDAAGAGLAVTQTAEDGVIEAVEHENLRLLGVQWHPERTALLSHHAGIADGSLLIHYFAEHL